MVFLADLMRAIDAPCECDFIALSSYGASTRSSGIVELTKDLSVPIEGRDVLIVEDIVDTGRTLAYLLRNLETRQPATLRVCTLLDKVARREVPVSLDYVGFQIPDEFVVGYGLDFAGLYRNLPYLGVLDAAAGARPGLTGTARLGRVPTPLQATRASCSAGRGMARASHGGGPTRMRAWPCAILRLRCAGLRHYRA